MLGYELDPSDPGLLAALEDFRADRERRIHAMADRLRELGFALDELLLRRAREPRPPAPRRRRAARTPTTPSGSRARASRGKKELFPPYLVPGAAAYVARSRPTVAEAIEVIHAAGGVAVWAHPFWDITDPEHVLATVRPLRGERPRRRRVLLRRAHGPSRPCCCTTSARRAGCSRPARPTSTAPTTSISTASVPSTSTAAHRGSGRSASQPTRGASDEDHHLERARRPAGAARRPARARAGRRRRARARARVLGQPRRQRDRRRDAQGHGPARVPRHARPRLRRRRRAGRRRGDRRLGRRRGLRVRAGDGPGGSRRSWAEPIVVPETGLARTPDGVDTATAGAAPLAAVTAMLCIDALGLSAATRC